MLFFRKFCVFAKIAFTESWFLGASMISVTRLTHSCLKLGHVESVTVLQGLIN